MATTAASSPRPTILPSRGSARVKSVLSGDTVVLLGKATTPTGRAPEVLFTLEGVGAPRMASKANANVDEPGAFVSREWLRQLLVGKMVNFETRKQGASAGDRVYGLLFFATEPQATPINVAIEAVKLGHATPKSITYSNGNSNNTPSNDASAAAEDVVDEYETNLIAAYNSAKNSAIGIHAPLPLVRSIKNSSEDFEALHLVQQAQKLVGRVKCVIEYIFDGSRFRCQVTDDRMADLQYANFTLLVAGISAPRIGNPRATPPVEPEEFSAEAKSFVELRVLQRELEISLFGTDKSGTCVVGTVHHPKGNIAVELCKVGLAKLSDWSVRMMNPMDVPALRVAENNAKRTNTGIWHSYAPPQLSGASEVSGTVVEVVTGDTIALLPNGEAYDSEDKLQKFSLASIRAPRVGNERAQRPDEPYALECKDRLRVLTVGKQVTVQIHYERDIPLGETTERRRFGTISTKNKPDVAEVLLSEGLATTQRHRDDDETSPRYDELRAAEATAKAAKKGIHSEAEYKRGSVNDLADPRKAKAYAGSLLRAGKLKAIVEYCFNGARFKMLVPSENCTIMFAPDFLRCPQPSPTPGSRQQQKSAEPFGDASKRHARLTLLQRSVEITCSGVTQGGVITGTLYAGQGAQRRDYGLELVGAGLATVDQRKIDYGEAPKELVDAQNAALENKVGIWSLDQPSNDKKKTAKTIEKHAEKVATIRLAEIKSGSHFFYHVANDGAARVMEESMKLFTSKNGTAGAPCDSKVGKVVAALFDDGTGKSWYRAKIIEKKGPGKVAVLFVDHGNVSTVPIASHLRPLDVSLGIDRFPPVATEAVLGLVITRPISDEEGVEAARMLQRLCWGKDLAARLICKDESGKVVASIISPDDSAMTVNEQIVSAGLARVAKPAIVQELTNRVVDSDSLLKLSVDLTAAQEVARKSRSGMWRYGDIGDEDDDEGY